MRLVPFLLWSREEPQLRASEWHTARVQPVFDRSTCSPPLRIKRSVGSAVPRTHHDVPLQQHHLTEHVLSVRLQTTPGPYVQKLGVWHCVLAHVACAVLALVVRRTAAPIVGIADNPSEMSFRSVNMFPPLRLNEFVESSYALGRVALLRQQRTTPFAP
jgi:hypothetical protein